MAMRYRYSEWDGTQELSQLDADQVLDALSDDLMNSGDLQHALRNMLQRGMQAPEQGQQGLRDLLQQLRQQRRDRLDQFDLGAVMEDIRSQLKEILDIERGTLRERLGESEDRADETDMAPESLQVTNPVETDIDQLPTTGNTSSDHDDSMPTERSADHTGKQAESGLTDEEQFQQILERIAQRKNSFLDSLPPDPSGQMKALQDYEFLSPEAQNRYQELVEQLRQAMVQSFFNQVSDAVEGMSEDDMQHMKDMVRDLNDMLAERMRGGEPDFESFMDKHGEIFGENPPQSLDELLSQMRQQTQAMQSVVDSMPSDQGQHLQSLLGSKFDDAELEAELSELAQNLDFLNPSNAQTSTYPFRGDEEIDLQAAMELMNEMQAIDDLETDLETAQSTGELDHVELDQLRELLGEDAVEVVEELKKLLSVLEDSGYIRKEGDKWELTPRGTRMIGQNALVEIFRELKKSGIGNHPVPQSGRYGERLDETKEYEFGDPFHLDMRRTIMNAIERDGPAAPVKLHPDDFEIYRSELVTETATVLMVDLSWSMALRGSFQAAKKVALALQNLIRVQYPRDSLYIIGFSAYARELKAQDLPYVRWDESVLGTNMHHALMIAERVLSKHRGGTRQILMISDGEPTAHLEHGRSQFSYPPSPITIRETLKAVKRVTQQGVTINTFMLDRNYYLKEFVNQLAKINGGRVFYTTPDQLGEYILVDYVKHKRKKISGRS